MIEILKNDLLEKIIITINNGIYARILVSLTKVFRFTNTRMREHCVIDHLPNEKSVFCSPVMLAFCMTRGHPRVQDVDLASSVPHPEKEII